MYILEPSYALRSALRIALGLISTSLKEATSENPELWSVVETYTDKLEP